MTINDKEAPKWFEVFEKGISNDLAEIKALSKENQRCLRGHNNTPGLVGRVDNLEKAMNWFIKGISAIILFLITTGLALVVNHLVTQGSVP